MRRAGLKVLIAPVALMLLGLSWSIASPLGSSADEQFHATNIWCAWGESETCEIAADGSTVSVPAPISKSFCYIKWPATAGAGCLSDFVENSYLADTLTSTSYFSLDSTYSPLFYKAIRTFVGTDVESTIVTMRVLNVLLAAIIFFWAFAVSTKTIRRALMLSWGLAIVPIGIFFISSINPSSWMITGIGTYWAFLATALSPEPSRRSRIFSWAGVAFSAGLALGSRTDAVIYLSILTLAVAILNAGNIRRHLNRITLIALVIVSVLIIWIGSRIFSNRFGILLEERNLSWGSDIPSGNLPAPLKTISELPAFFYGLFGAQGPFSDVYMGLYATEGIRTSGFSYGLGWTEFDLPSFVGIFGGTATLIVLFIGFRTLTLNRLISVAVLVVSFATLILLVRATIDFTTIAQIQPRYLFPLALASIGTALVVKIHDSPLLSRSQTLILVLVLTISGSIAWLATASRYAVGPKGVLTNFGQPHEWWGSVGPGRLGWFIIASAAMALWVYSTIWIWGRKSLTESGARQS